MVDRVKADCRKLPSDQPCTVTIAGSVDEIVELGWLHAKAHHQHKDNQEKDLKNWIRTNAEPAAD